ncbi:MAG: hypothetical protein PHZ02_14715 [Desulfocapsaceae bacterium]|nr:hypothetical protein [Desulfocapsaceae bacterium]
MTRSLPGVGLLRCRPRATHVTLVTVAGARSRADTTMASTRSSAHSLAAATATGIRTTASTTTTTMPTTVTAMAGSAIASVGSQHNSGSLRNKS